MTETATPPPSILVLTNAREIRLRPHKNAKKRGLPTGRRRVTVWDIPHDDDALAVEFRTGKQVTRMILSHEAIDALTLLRNGWLRFEATVEAKVEAPEGGHD